MTRRKIAIIGVTVAGIVATALVAGATAGSEEATAAAPDRTVPVVRRTVVRPLLFQGSVEFARQAELSATTEAIVAAVPVKLGQRVSAGDILVVLDDREAAAEREAASRERSRLSHWLTAVYPAQRRSLEAEGRLLKLKLEVEQRALAAKLRATQEAAREGVATPGELAAAEREASQAAAQAAASRAAHAAQRAALEQQRLEARLGSASAAEKRLLSDGQSTGHAFRAPFDATVTAVSAAVDARAPVSAGAHLVSLVDTRSFAIRVTVPAAEAYRLSARDPVSCRLPRRGRAVACRLIDIAKIGTDYVARFALTNVDDVERGEAGDVRLLLRGPRDTLSVPVTALAHRGEVVGVHVVDSSGSRFVPVTVRFFGEDAVAIEGELRAGERVRLDG